MFKRALLVLLLVPLAAAHELDEMWLRQPMIADDALLAEARVAFHSIVVQGAEYQEASKLLQLQTVAEELREGLNNLLDQSTSTTCCDDAPDAEIAAGTLLVTVGVSQFSHLGPEGFAISNLPLSNNGHAKQTYQLHAATPSGALYGAFRLLSYLQRGMMVPEIESSIPAMQMRTWDLWDDLGGDVTRGFAGDSIVWPNALWKNPDTSDGPAPFKLFVAPCNASDPYQQWSGSSLDQPDNSTASLLIHNRGSDQCISTNGETIAECSEAGVFWYNSTAQQLSLGPLEPGVVGSARQCLDINHALGPDIDTYHCHPVYPGGGERDFKNQQFDIRPSSPGSVWKSVVSLSAAEQCLTLRNSFPPSPAAPHNVSWSERFDGMLRLLKSAGVNGITLNDVNACYQENQVTEDLLLLLRDKSRACCCIVNRKIHFSRHT